MVSLSRLAAALSIVCLSFALSPAPAAEEGSGRVEGRVTRSDGTGIGGVTVRVKGLNLSETTDPRGHFAFAAVPAGARTLEFRLGESSAVKEDVTVRAGATVRADLEVDWQPTYLETVTVYSASRRTERVVDAPAAVTVVSEDQIKREAPHGQLPKLLEFTPGAEITQSGLYDFNFNTRGFNSSLNRRVAVLVDGRDISVPFLGAQEWAAVTMPLDDLESLELVRGPSAALYGANASSGVLNMTTRPPRYSEGGLVRITGGELSTGYADFRWAGKLGAGWFAKVNAGLRDSGDFSDSRNGRAEYSVPCSAQGQTDCLPQEAVPLAREDDNDIWFGSLRFDKYLDNGSVFTLEGGTADIAGPVVQTGIGRVQLIDVKRPWGRFNFSADHWNFLAYYNERDAPEQLALSSGTNIALDETNLTLEVQTNWKFAGDRVRLVGGASWSEEEIDTFDPKVGAQTLLFEPLDSDFKAVFAQVDWTIVEPLKLVVAARWDDSSLHDAEFSPKASLLYRLRPDHSLRLTYNEAFQVANYSEFFLQARAAPNADLSQLEGLCLVSGVFDCGLAGPAFGGPGTRVLALGNDDLKLEKVKTIELGYQGIFGARTYLTVDYYNSENEDFITDLLPQLATPLGRINSDFGPWRGSQAAESRPCAINPAVTVADCIRALAPLLSNNFDGENIIAAVSYTNFGRVDTQGADIALNQAIGADWLVSVSYSWFDFDIKDELPGFENLLLPNSPEHKAGASVSFARGGVDATLSARWVDDFRWGVGPFQGDVESYTTVNLSANYAINPNWKIGATVSNLFDDDHWEAFGGDLLKRRALGHVTFGW